MYYVTTYSPKECYHTDTDCRSFPDSYRTYESLDDVPDGLQECGHCQGRDDKGQNNPHQKHILADMGIEVNDYQKRDDRGW
jgi:hypothetical protein